jgi:Arc/MetJ-type ribon-helix-helix transcriptional regulator
VTIALQPEQEQFIQAQLPSGRYTNAAEAIVRCAVLSQGKSRKEKGKRDLQFPPFS